jgi:hypothetical protein
MDGKMEGWVGGGMDGWREEGRKVKMDGRREGTKGGRDKWGK